MTLFRALVVLAMIALATGEELDVDNEIVCGLCNDLDEEMAERDELRNDGKKAFEYAKKFVETKTLNMDLEKRLIAAWGAVSQAECSPSSWEHILLMNKCYSDHMYALEEPLKAYPKKCLTSDSLTQRVKRLTSGKFAIHVDMIDGQFMEKLFGHEPSDRDAVFRLYTTEELPFVTKEKSTRAVVDAIKRDFAKQGKDPKEAFYGNLRAVSEYLSERLFKPCEYYLESYDYILDELRAVGSHLSDGQRELLNLMDRDAKRTILRLSYCALIDDSKKFRREMVRNVASQI